MPVYIDAVAMRIIPTEYALKGAVCGISPHLGFFVIEVSQCTSERSLSKIVLLSLTHRCAGGET